VPRYFFHIEDGVKLRDPTGIELADIGAAQQEAIAIAGKVIVQGGKSPWNGEEWTLTVTDDRNMTMFRLAFSGTLAPALKQAVCG
jgi:hypothetical protein